MFSLNEDNRFVMAQHPCDMRMGVNAMCGQVRMAGLNLAGGDVYVFVDCRRILQGAPPNGKLTLFALLFRACCLESHKEYVSLHSAGG